MKKSELKVGVEYACFPLPTDARAFNYGREWKRPTPFKATLVSLDFTESRMSTKSVNYGHQQILEPKMVSGIAVDTGTKVCVKGDVPVRNIDNSYVINPNKEAPNRIITTPGQFEYDYRVLENAGCFLMTWAEYEDTLVQKAAAEQRLAEKKATDEQARRDAEAGIMDRIAAVKTVLRNMGVVTEKLDTRDYVPEKLHVKADRRDHDFDALLSAEYTHGYGPDGERVVTGLIFGMGTRGGGVTLSTMEAVIEAAKKSARMEA